MGRDLMRSKIETACAIVVVSAAAASVVGAGTTGLEGGLDESDFALTLVENTTLGLYPARLYAF